MFENIEVMNPKHVEWIKMVNEQRESGLTIKEWCRRKHLSKNTFYYRKKRLHALYDNVPALSFIEVDRSIFGENNTAAENNAESGRKAKTASGMVCEAAEKPAEDNCSSAVDASIPVHAYAEAVAALQVQGVSILLSNNASEALIGRIVRAVSW